MPAKTRSELLRAAGRLRERLDKMGEAPEEQVEAQVLYVMETALLWAAGKFRGSLKNEAHQNAIVIHAFSAKQEG